MKNRVLLFQLVTAATLSTAPAWSMHNFAHHDATTPMSLSGQTLPAAFSDTHNGARRERRYSVAGVNEILSSAEQASADLRARYQVLAERESEMTEKDRARGDRFREMSRALNAERLQFQQAQREFENKQSSARAMEEALVQREQMVASEQNDKRRAKNKVNAAKRQMFGALKATFELPGLDRQGLLSVVGQAWLSQQLPDGSDMEVSEDELSVVGEEQREGQNDEDDFGDEDDAKSDAEHCDTRQQERTDRVRRSFHDRSGSFSGEIHLNCGEVAQHEANQLAAMQQERRAQAQQERDQIALSERHSAELRAREEHASEQTAKFHERQVEEARQREVARRGEEAFAQTYMPRAQQPTSFSRDTDRVEYSTEKPQARRTMVRRDSQADLESRDEKRSSRTRTSERPSRRRTMRVTKQAPEITAAATHQWINEQQTKRSERQQAESRQQAQVKAEADKRAAAAQQAAEDKRADVEQLAEAMRLSLREQEEQANFAAALALHDEEVALSQGRARGRNVDVAVSAPDVKRAEKPAAASQAVASSPKAEKPSAKADVQEAKVDAKDAKKDKAAKLEVKRSGFMAGASRRFGN